MPKENYLTTVRQLKGEHGYRILDGLFGACFDPWRPLRLRIDGSNVKLYSPIRASGCCADDDEPRLALSPDAEVTSVSPAKLASYDWAWLWPWIRQRCDRNAASARSDRAQHPYLSAMVS